MSIKTAIQNLEASIAHCITSKDFSRARALLDIVETLSALPAGKDELTDKEISVLRAEGLVSAIKELRSRAGLTLKEAKDLIDSYIAKNGLVRVESIDSINGMNKITYR